MLLLCIPCQQYSRTTNLTVPVKAVQLDTLSYVLSATSFVLYACVRCTFWLANEAQLCMCTSCSTCRCNQLENASAYSWSARERCLRGRSRHWMCPLAKGMPLYDHARRKSHMDIDTSVCLRSFTGIMFNVRAHDLPFEYMEITSVWLRGKLGPITIWYVICTLWSPKCIAQIKWHHLIRSYDTVTGRHCHYLDTVS